MQERVREELPGLANRFEALVFDLDGVVYRGSRPLPHAIRVLNLLHDAGREVYFLTNNSGATRQQYAERLQAMGYPMRAPNSSSPLAGRPRSICAAPSKRARRCLWWASQA
jgi:phosphoglycolate phosphatase-like HAD superfamily hydrolase